MELAQLSTRTLAMPTNTGMPTAIVTGNVVLLRLFVACGSSAPVRIAHESDAALWGGGLGGGYSGGTKCPATQTASATGAMALSIFS